MAYKLVPSYKKRLKIIIEKEPCMKKKRIKKLSYEEKLYNEAVEAKRRIFTDNRIISGKMCNKKTSLAFNCNDFEIIKNSAKGIRQKEVLYYLLFAVILTVYTVVTALAAVYTKIPYLFLTIIPICAVLWKVFTPKKRFKELFNDVYLPVCYWCANVQEVADMLSFDIKDKKKNWDKKTANVKVITNKFKIKTETFLTEVEKMLVRNYVTTYKMKNGEMTVGKKMATIFSGYSFELQYDSLISGYKDDEILLALINKNTFYGTDGLYSEDSSVLSMEKINHSLLSSDWSVYRRDGFDVDKKTLKEIQKKILMINNVRGAFNAYITPNGVRMMIPTQLNRDGLKEEFFQAQLKNPESLTYNGFFSIVKTLYIVSCMNKFIKILFGIKDMRHLRNSNTVDRIKKKGPEFLEEKNYTVKPKTKIEKTEKKESKKIFFNKKGETSVSTAIALLITVILSGLILMGFISLIDNNVSPKLKDRIDSGYSETERDKTVTESDLS